MKKVEINVLTYDELSDEAKERAYNNWLKHHDYAWQDSNTATLKAFCDMFPVKCNDFEYGSGGRDYVSWKFTDDDHIAELSGIRLMAYLWNNFSHKLYKGKYYSLDVNKQINHKRVVSKLLSNGKWFNAYYSAITLNNSCVLTGYCVDDDILKPIYNFLDHPIEPCFKDHTFYDLMDACFNAWLKVCIEDYEYSCSQECFAEDCESNEYEFTEDGEMF
jgi:hypothetical protein